MPRTLPTTLPSWTLVTASLLSGGVSCSPAGTPRDDVTPPEKMDAAVVETRDTSSTKKDGPVVAMDVAVATPDTRPPEDVAVVRDSAVPDAAVADAGAKDTGAADAANAGPATLANVYKLVQQHCNECHENAGNGFVVGADATKFYTNVTTKTAQDACANTLYVTPSNVSKSVLYQVISGTACVKTMPPSAPLDPAIVKVIGDWIKAGAPK